MSNDTITDEPATLNAIIENPRIFIEDHGMWTSYLMLHHERGVQGYGGYNLDFPGSMLLWVSGVCKLVGVDDWASLRGKHIRIKQTNWKITAIGHYLEDRWFNFEEALKNVPPATP
jgi:hypothetical protein